MTAVHHPNAPDHWRKVQLMQDFYPDSGWTFGYATQDGEVHLASSPFHVGFNSEDDLRRVALYKLNLVRERHGDRFVMVKAFRFDK